MMEHYRGRIATVSDALAVVTAELESKGRWTTGLALVMGIAALVFVVVAILLGFAAGAAVSASNTTAGHLTRSRFGGSLCALLADEILPRSTVDLQFDRRDTRDPNHLERTALSTAGNTKAYYKQRWLRLTVTLPDRTLVQISRKAFKKTKKGSVTKHYRYLAIKVRPPGDLIGVRERLPQLKSLLRKAIRSSFHDPPEEVHVHPALTNGALHIKIVQHDAPFLAEEVIAIMQATLQFVYPPAARR